MKTFPKAAAPDAAISSEANEASIVGDDLDTLDTPAACLALLGVCIVSDDLDTPAALLAEIGQSIDSTTATMYAAVAPDRYKAMLGTKRDKARRVAIGLAAGDAELPALPPRVDDALADLHALGGWCIEATRGTSVAGVDNSQRDEHWTAPMSKAEAARRVMGRHDARWRDMCYLLPASHVQDVPGRNAVRIRVDDLDAGLRAKLERPASP